MEEEGCGNGGNAVQVHRPCFTLRLGLLQEKHGPIRVIQRPGQPHAADDIDSSGCSALVSGPPSQGELSKRR